MRLVAALFGLLAVIAPQVSAQISSAHAVLHPFYNSTTANTASPLFGTVDFYQNNDGSGLVNITVKIAGLQANKNYSLHVHQFGNLAGFLSDILTSTILTTNTTLSNVGPHFNPFNQAHGCGVGSARHAGDVGNVSIPDGTAETAWTTVYLQSELLDLGINNTFSYDSIIGRAVVLREFADACDETQLGGYLAVGVIGINDTNSKAVADAQPTDDTNSAPKAVALIFNTISQKPVGYINFWTDAKNGTHMSGVVSGFPPRSVHGIHVHASGNEDTNITIGTHWTGPTGTSHGLPPFNNRHWGDLGNVIADSKGVITFQDIWAPLNLISVWNSTNSILGRAIAIHEGKDDGTITTYGPRYNFGVIGLADTLFQLPGVPAPEYPTVARAQVILRAFYNTNATTSGTWPDAPLVGNITFTQNVDGTGDVNVTVVVAGLRGGASGRDYGLHIHDWGNEFNSFDHTTGARITNLTALANAVDPNLGGVGPHFNPFLQPHGCGYGNFARHAGDIGNVSVAANGDADRFTFFTYQLKSELLDLGRNQYNNDSIIGRTITLHDRPNPCDGTVPLGNWIAIGVIGIDSTNIGTLKEQNVAQQEQLTFNPNNNSPKANAVIRDFRGNNGTGQIVGDIFFWSGQNGEIRMGGAVAGFPPGSSHGVHIHQFGNENNNLTIGPHWAAPGQDGNEFHQLPPYAGRHFGDVIGNVTADANGVISFMNVTAGFDLLSLTTAANSIIGHSIAFHEFVDDGNSVTPSYGPRYKFGVIGMVHPDFPIPTSFNAIVFPPAGSTSSPGTTTAPPSTNGTTTAPPITNGTTTAPPITNGTTTSPPTNGTGTTTVPPTGKPPNAAHTISSTIANLVAALLAVAVVALL